MADDPRGLLRGLAGRFFPVLHALPVAPALCLPLFLTRRRGPVLLLGLPLGPLPRVLSTRSTAVALQGLLRMKGLLTSLQQTRARPRPPCRTHVSPSGCLLILGTGEQHRWVRTDRREVIKRNSTLRSYLTRIRFPTAVDLYLALAIVVLAPKRAPSRAGTPSNRTFVAVIWVGTVRSNRADRKNESLG